MQQEISTHDDGGSVFEYLMSLGIGLPALENDSWVWAPAMSRAGKSIINLWVTAAEIARENPGMAELIDRSVISRCDELFYSG